MEWTTDMGRTYTDNVDTIEAVYRYCKARNRPNAGCYVTFTNPELAHIPYAGVSVELTELNRATGTAVIRSANGDLTTVGLSTITIAQG